MAQHTVRGGGPVHAWDCAPCVAEAAERTARHEETNPHRPGTKAHANRAAMDRSSAWACDPRTETYWSM